MSKNKSEPATFLAKEQKKTEETNNGYKKLFSSSSSTKKNSANINGTREPFVRSKTSIEKKSPKLNQFAEDLFNDHITRSLSNFQSSEFPEKFKEKEISQPGKIDLF
jgi:hypothetical protein